MTDTEIICLFVAQLTLLVYYSHAPHSLSYDEIETCVTILSITIGILHNKSKIIRQIYATILR